MAARCLLAGHSFSLIRGAGQYRDQEFMVCDICGWIERVTPKPLDQRVVWTPRDFEEISEPPALD